ncbi:hypothetical protein ATI02_0737 [Pseudomonas baetica]|uniref:DUF1534 domain-containing protein n=1 Tax=Pseudomonas baetica TaxID=674054 RepID=A0ABX4PT28_9PSED|nr:hypothetical protein ATI02_0737 [Pseudomonas baetica]
MPRICRLPRPADNCHSNKYPLWVSAIDENARSLRPDVWRVNPQKEVCRGMWGMFRKGSGTECVALLMAPSRASPLPHFVLRTQNHCGSGLARESGRSGAAELSWQSPAVNRPSNDAHGACHAHTASLQGSGFRFYGAFDGPFASKPAPTFCPAYTEPLWERACSRRRPVRRR